MPEPGQTGVLDGRNYVADEDGNWNLAPGSNLESFGLGVASAAADNILLPAIPFELAGGLLSGLGAENTGQALSSVGQNLRQTRNRIRPEAEAGAQIRDPFAFFGGNILGSAFPGKIGTQAVVSGLIEGGRGETASEQLVGGTLGATVTLASDALARKAQQRLSRSFQRSQGEAQATRSVEAQRLEELGVDLPERAFAGGDKEGGAAMRDRLRQLTSPGASVRDKRYSINKLVTETLLPEEAGTNALTSRWRSALAKKVRDGYAQVRELLPTVIEQTESADQMALEMTGITEQILPSRRSDVDFYVNRILQSYGADQLTPKWWSAARSNIATAARSAPDSETMKALYQVRTALDDIVLADNPQARQLLRESNERWQFQEVLNAPGSISSERHVNPTATIRNLERMFGQLYDSASQAPEKAKFLYEVLDASRQFPEFQTSGTGEMLTASSLSRTLNARVQLQAGTLGDVTGGAIGRSLVKGTEGVVEAGATTVEAIGKAGESIYDQIFGDSTDDPDN